MNDPFILSEDKPINPQDPEDLRKVLEGLKKIK
jgi:hypothetical protein